MARAEDGESVARFLPELTSPRQARHFVRRSCAGWGAPEVIDVAVLLTSELVTNAVVHARTAVTVAVTQSEGGLRVAVTDDGEAAPALTPGRGMDEAGRGLALVDHLSAAWGVTSSAGGRVGKTVWFTLSAN